MKSKLIGLITIAVVVFSSAVVVGIFLYWDNMSRVYKPAIYLYNNENESFEESLTVFIPNGFATLTIPEIPLGKEITWDNIEVLSASQILVGVESYPYLFYEAIIRPLDLQSFERGWVIHNKNVTWTVNGGSVDNLEIFITESLTELGLYDNEIKDFAEYWFGEHPIFEGDGTYILRQIPAEVINENFQLETINQYSMNRVFFTYSYFSEFDDFDSLLPPENLCQNITSDFILHEWGIIF